MDIRGYFFDGKTARAVDAGLEVRGRQLRVVDRDGLVLVPWSDIRACRVAPPLGRTRRIIAFSRGERFETQDLGAMAELESRAGLSRSMVHLLESRWRWVAACLIILVGCAYAVFNPGIPLMADWAARRIPPGLLDQASLKARAILMEEVLKPSTLDPVRMERIRAGFRDLAAELARDPSDDFSLEFADGGALGANAFALPSGTIILTDQLVRLSDDMREIQGVLVHEITHVTRRHALRSVIQNTGVVMLISLVLGDVGSITGLAVSLPALLAETGYSRAFELEADTGVALYFKDKGWDIRAFENILMRLTRADTGFPGRSFISTHPDTRERIANLRKVQNR